MKEITIAIDGYAGCGKSSTAQAVAACLGYIYIDSGAMYRAVTLYLLRAGIDYAEETPALLSAVAGLEIDFVRPEGSARPLTRLNGEIVEEAIRTPEVSAAVSPVARHGGIRRKVVAQQQEMGRRGGVVMDGRDIGTVVFPEAELKVFMQADMAVRAERRRAELLGRGIDEPLEAVMHNLAERDHIDSTRAVSPLRQAADAVVVDTTHLSFDQQVEEVCKLARRRIAAQASAS
ncbi:MAG: (d)CMP kinase [Bacteroidetes bacterium]|nr:MAG: (d)CMP kinase [Bacteroidota bacterium]